jgi:hypothetical protein
MSQHAEQVDRIEQVELKLVKIERHAEDPLPLERRIAHRKPASGRVTALLAFKDGEEHRNRICSLELRDISDTGVGAVTSEPLPREGNITIFLPPHGPERGFDLYGQIMWCRDNRDGGDDYEVGVRLNRQASACA